jgi:hypothetical protein
LKRLGVTVATVAMMVVMTAGQALAQYPPSKPPPAGPGPNGSAVPFTGTNITLGVVILIALLVVGTLLLLLGRRRRVRASS